jgi:two-component system sensor histidine kinase BaeS
VALSHDVEAGARIAVLDRRMILQAVDALVRNGIRFTPDGGSVTVQAREDREELILAVKDTGIGLTTEARERLFDDAYVPRDSRHHRTSRGLEFNVAGLGFGLAYVRRVVEAHGGRMEVASEEGKGSVFSLHFPGAISAPDAMRKAA